ncbi:MAG: hypothetical protein IKN30_08180 [Synergistaceae bacterium]|nr:hypothetical protein [Synergistaceae bacterium]
MSENIKELYSKTDFIVTGGALKILTDFLNEKNIKALVVEKGSTDTLNVIDAAGIVPQSLTLKDNITDLFASGIAKENFELEFSHGHDDEWPGVIRVRGSEWEVYILLKEIPENPQALIEELKPCAGLIRLWQNFKKISDNEKKLSRLSYMILATKSTLASIFEPMPLQYFASFLADVLQESLFPKSVTILRDEGNYLTVFNGQADNIPAREGIFAAQILPPTPVITKRVSPVEIVLPVTEGDCRLFCVMQWDKLPDEQMMNFMELLGNLAVRAIAINNLRQQSRENEANISTGEFTVLSLSNVLKVLRAAGNREKFFSLLVDIFMEQSRMKNCLLATWDKSRKGYVISENRTGHFKANLDTTLLPSSGGAVSSEKVGEASYNLNEKNPDVIFKTWGLAGCPVNWKEIIKSSSMKYIFPVCDDNSLVGLIALGGQEGRTALDRSQLASLQLIAQFAAYEFKRFD